MTDKIDSSQHSCSKRKTVHDAVEAYNGVWPKDEQDDLVCIWDSCANEFTFWCSDYQPVSFCYEVCTREEFEKARDEKENEKVEWSCHTNVPISFTDRNGDVYELNDCCGDRAEYYKAKPTITKSQAWDMFVNDGWATWDIIEKHTITD